MKGCNSSLEYALEVLGKKKENAKAQSSVCPSCQP